MMNQIMIIIYGPEILNIYRFIRRIFIIFIPHCEPALLAHSALHVDVTGCRLRTVDVVVEVTVFVQLFVTGGGLRVVLVVHNLYQLFVQTVEVVVGLALSVFDVIQYFSHLVQLVLFPSNFKVWEQFFDFLSSFFIKNFPTNIILNSIFV